MMFILLLTFTMSKVMRFAKNVNLTLYTFFQNNFLLFVTCFDITNCKVGHSYSANIRQK